MVRAPGRTSDSQITSAIDRHGRWQDTAIGVLALAQKKAEGMGYDSAETKKQEATSNARYARNPHPNGRRGCIGTTSFSLSPLRHWWGEGWGEVGGQRRGGTIAEGRAASKNLKQRFNSTNEETRELYHLIWAPHGQRPHRPAVMLRNAGCLHGWIR